MAASSVIELTNEFADGTSQKVSIGTIAPTAISPTLKQDIIAFNASMQSAGYGSYLQSKYGADWTGISACRIITTETTYIF